MSLSNIGQWNGGVSSMKITLLLHLPHSQPLNPNPSLLLYFTQKPNSLSSHHLLLQQLPFHICCRSSSKWDSNAETIKNQNFSELGGFQDEEEEFDGDEILDQGAQVFEEHLQSIWIFKVFGSYGWSLPPILIALLITGGPKAFLMALAIPLGQSTFSFAIQKMLDPTQYKPTTRKSTKTKKRQRTSSRTNFWRRGGNPKTRKRKTGYQSWVSNNDVSTTSKDEQEVSKYGGWDELDQETESNYTGFKTSAQSSIGPSDIPTEKSKLSTRKAKSDTPLLLRLLISMFPFLASWTKLL